MRSLIILILSCASVFAADTTGTGCPVIGKLLIPEIVTNAPNYASLPPSRWYVQFSDSSTNQTVNYEVEATLYGTNRQLKAQMALDGTFRVEDVPAGTWWLLADILSFPAGRGNATTVATVGRNFVVPEMTSGRSDELLDLGTLKPMLVHSPQVGEAAPMLKVKTTDGGTFNLSDHRGQYVLLNFEPMNIWRYQTNQSVQAVWDAFGKNDRLAMLTLQVPPTSSYVYFKSADTDYSWPQTRLMNVPWYESKPLRASYGLQTDRDEMDTNLPAILLVGPDGKIIAKDLHGDDITAAVAKALGGK
jgi:hypothetical protein